LVGAWNEVTRMPERKMPSVSEAAAQAERERELRKMMQRVEDVKSGVVPPEKESPHDFVEKKMREKPEK
jgi:nitroimidazol reductase NimA-like FMN-containing flavoprotein (pyridoxamine 5'-phosphate oxidase superfamily)